MLIYPFNIKNCLFQSHAFTFELEFTKRLIYEATGSLEAGILTYPLTPLPLFIREGEGGWVIIIFQKYIGLILKICEIQRKIY
jgi:hypothetical protein